MTAWLSVLVPLLVMFFALGMERVESRLRESTVRQEELEEFLDQPRPDEVRALSARARAVRWSCSGCAHGPARPPTDARTSALPDRHAPVRLTRVGGNVSIAASPAWARTP